MARKLMAEMIIRRFPGWHTVPKYAPPRSANTSRIRPPHALVMKITPTRVGRGTPLQRAMPDHHNVHICSAAARRPRNAARRAPSPLPTFRQTWHLHCARCSCSPPETRRASRCCRRASPRARAASISGGARSSSSATQLPRRRRKLPRRARPRGGAWFKVACGVCSGVAPTVLGSPRRSWSRSNFSTRRSSSQSRLAAGKIEPCGGGARPSVGRVSMPSANSLGHRALRVARAVLQRSRSPHSSPAAAAAPIAPRIAAIGERLGGPASRFVHGALARQRPDRPARAGADRRRLRAQRRPRLDAARSPRLRSAWSRTARSRGALVNAFDASTAATSRTSPEMPEEAEARATTLLPVLPRRRADDDARRRRPGRRRALTQRSRCSPPRRHGSRSFYAHGLDALARLSARDTTIVGSSDAASGPPLARRPKPSLGRLRHRRARDRLAGPRGLATGSPPRRSRRRRAADRAVRGRMPTLQSRRRRGAAGQRTARRRLHG
jgi:hypothetical protein